MRFFLCWICFFSGYVLNPLCPSLAPIYPCIYMFLRFKWPYLLCACLNLHTRVSMCASLFGFVCFVRFISSPFISGGGVRDMYSLPQLYRAGTINVGRPVFYTPKYIESNGILSNYMVINYGSTRTKNDHIITSKIPFHRFVLYFGV